MRVAFVLAILIFPLLMLNYSALAQESTGSTIINVTIPGSIVLNFSYPEIVIPEDYYFYENLTVFHSDAINISVYLNKSDSNNFVKFVNNTNGETYYQDDYTLYLPLNSNKNATIRVYVPPSQGYNGGTYNIQIYARSLSDYRSNVTALKVQVNNTNPIDDIEITNIYPSSLYPGEALSTNILIHKIYPAKVTDIQICYCINPNPNYMCGPSYNNYGCEWKAITEWLNYTKTVTVNENAGTYYFIIAIKYPGDETIKRANSPQFYVKSVPSITPSGPGGAVPVFTPSQAKLTISAPDYLESYPGQKVGFSVEIKNTGNEKASNTTLNVYGLPENWASTTPLMQDIDVGKSKNYSVSISLSSTAFEQVYSLFLVAKSGSEEATKIITMTVASSAKDMAELLLNEAKNKKNEAERILLKLKNFGMDSSGPEKNMSIANLILTENERLFASGNYKLAINKSKEAIDEYKATIFSAKGIFETEYFVLLQNINSELTNAEKFSKDTNVIKSVISKISESVILQKEERIIEAYEVLLDAKQLLDQLWEKIRMGEMTNFILILSIEVIIAVVLLTFIFYVKRISRFIKKARIEEQKKNLEYVFKREVRPGIAYKEVKHKEMPAKEVPRPAKEEREPEMNKEKFNEILKLMKTGASLFDKDTEKGKEVYLKVRRIYNSLSPKEKKIFDEEISRVLKMHEEKRKKSGE